MVDWSIPNLSSHLRVAGRSFSASPSYSSDCGDRCCIELRDFQTGTHFASSAASHSSCHSEARTAGFSGRDSLIDVACLLRQSFFRFGITSLS